MFFTVYHFSLFSITAVVSVAESSSSISLGRINSVPLLAVKVSGIWPHILALLLSGLVIVVNTAGSDAVTVVLLYRPAVSTF